MTTFTDLPREVRGVIIPLTGGRVLLPNATVAEMMSRVPVQPIEGAPAWLAGYINWQGWEVPLLSYARFSNLGDEPLGGNNKVVVLKALGGNPEMPYFALLTQSFPQLIAVPRDGLLADATEEELPVGVKVRVLLGDEAAVLPDLEVVETMIGEALANAA